MSATDRLLPLLPAPRQAHDLARLLDVGADPLDAAPALRPMLTVAQGLQALPHDGAPSPEFRAALRKRLVAVAAVQSMAPPASAATRELRSGRRSQRRLAVATGSLAAVIALAGVAVGADRSLPGDPLYAIKRGTESAQLLVTSGDDDRGRKHLEYARTRLHEISKLLDSSSALGPAALGQPLAAGRLGASVSDRLTDALGDMDSDTLAGSRDLTQAFRDDHDRNAVVTLRTFADEQQAQLTALLPQFPAAAAPRAERSLSLLDQVERRAVALLADGPSPKNTQEDRLGVLPRASSPASPAATGGGQTPSSTPTPTVTPTTGGAQSGGPQPAPSSSPAGQGIQLPTSPSVTDPTGLSGILQGLLGGGTGTSPLPAPTVTAPSTGDILPGVGVGSTLPLPIGPTSVPTATPSSGLLPLPLPDLPGITSGGSLLP